LLTWQATRKLLVFKGIGSVNFMAESWFSDEFSAAAVIECHEG